MSRIPRIGWVREASLLVPLVVLLLVLISTFTLFAFRGAILTIGETLESGGDAVARELTRQDEIATRLLWVALPVNVALTLFSLLFLRRLLRPFEQLMESAKEVADPEDVDDVGFLIATFERAVESLASESPDAPGRDADDEEIAALQRALGQNLDSGVLLLDEENRVLAINAVGRELLEVDDLGSSRPPVEELLEGHPPIIALLDEIAHTDRSASRVEIETRTSTDAQLALGLSAHPLKREDGSRRGTLTLFADLTQARRKAADQRRSDNLAQLGRMSAGLAHELRNSLATLKGYLTLIDKRPDESSVDDYLGEIRKESDQLQRVLEDFLSFARPEPRLEEIALVPLVRRIAGDPASPVAVECQTDVEDGLCIEADASLLERALRNLLRNAVEAHLVTQPEAPIVVRLSMGTDWIDIEFLDRGPGLPETGPDRLFEPFTTTRPEGVGLGLPLAERIFTLHSGRLSLEARDGGGTVAVARLPLDIIVSKSNA